MYLNFFIIIYRIYHKLYRIISLLNCLEKTLEKILSTRLGFLVNTSNLLEDT